MLYRRTKLIDRIEQFEFLFKEAEPLFDFPISPGVFQSHDDRINIVFVEEVLERMAGEIAVPCRDDPGTVVGQDLAGV